MNKELNEKLNQLKISIEEVLNEINTEEDIHEFWEESIDLLYSLLNKRSIEIEEL